MLLNSNTFPVNLRKFFEQHGCVFLTPGSVEKSKTIFQWDEEANGIIEIATKDIMEGLVSKVLNHQV